MDRGQEFAKWDRPRNASYSKKEEEGEHNDQIFGIFANHTLHYLMFMKITKDMKKRESLVIEAYGQTHIRKETNLELWRF